MGDCIGGDTVAVSPGITIKPPRAAPRPKTTKSPHQLRLEHLFSWAYLQAEGAKQARLSDHTLSARHDQL